MNTLLNPFFALLAAAFFANSNTGFTEDAGCCGDSDSPTKKVARAAAAAAAGTTSPFQPPDEKLGVYVVNTGSGLDTGCTFRSGGPLIVRLSVPSVVNDNEIGADGLLKNPNKLISSGAIGATVNVRFPVYDIDSGATGTGNAPEIDRISFNGRFIKTLSGINNTWTDDSFTVPISELKFVSTNSPSAVNEFKVDIDTGNTTEAWCMAIDWVAAEFDCAAPYVLAHGINADASSWDEDDAPGVLSELDDAGVRYTRFSVTSNGTVIGNGLELLGHIQSYLDGMKADKVHIIAHSKGGLDTQAMVAFNPKFKVLSLSTLATPHLGSVSADLSVIQKMESDELINTGADPNGFVADYVGTETGGFGPQLPGLRDLQTEFATTAIRAGIRGNISPTFTYSADADLNGNNELENSESDGLFPGIFHYAARRSWRVNRDFASARVVSLTTQPGRFFGKRTVITYQTTQTAGAQANDIVVTQASANPSYGSPSGHYDANHSTIKQANVIATILSKTLNLR